MHIPSEHFRAARAAANKANPIPDMIPKMSPSGASAIRVLAGISLAEDSAMGAGGITVSFRLTHDICIS